MLQNELPSMKKTPTQPKRKTKPKPTKQKEAMVRKQEPSQWQYQSKEQ